MVIFESSAESMQLLGEFDRHIQVVEQIFDVRLIPRGLTFTIEGPEREVVPVWDLLRNCRGIYARAPHIRQRVRIC